MTGKTFCRAESRARSFLSNECLWQYLPANDRNIFPKAVHIKMKAYLAMIFAIAALLIFSGCSFNQESTQSQTGLVANISASPSPSPSPACRDSERDKNYFVKGTVVRGGISRTDSCVRNSGKGIVEYWCENNSIQATTDVECEFGCSNGKCNRNPVDNTDESDSEICSDSDGGIFSTVKGEITNGSGNLAQDYCKDKNSLVEYYCTQDNNNGFAQFGFRCPAGCEEGACLPYSGAIIVSVRDFSGQKPVPNSRVVIWSSDLQVVATGTTERSGNISFQNTFDVQNFGFAQGRHYIDVQASGYEINIQPLEFTPGSDSKINIALSNTASDNAAVLPFTGNVGATTPKKPCAISLYGLRTNPSPPEDLSPFTIEGIINTSGSCSGRYLVSVLGYTFIAGNGKFSYGTFTGFGNQVGGTLCGEAVAAEMVPANNIPIIGMFVNEIPSGATSNTVKVVWGVKACDNIANCANYTCLPPKNFGEKGAEYTERLGLSDSDTVVKISGKCEYYYEDGGGQIQQGKSDTMLVKSACQRYFQGACMAAFFPQSCRYR